MVPSTEDDALARRVRAAESRLAQLSAEGDALAARLADAEQALASAREALTLVNVKLDILEGAANVLDRRLRRAAPDGP